MYWTGTYTAKVLGVVPLDSCKKLLHCVMLTKVIVHNKNRVTLTVRKLEQEILAAGHHVCILTTISGDPDNTHMDGEHPNRQVVFLENSVPIPFLSDEERPELSYHLGFSLSPSVKQKLDDFEPSIVHITVPDCTSLHIIQYARDRELPIMGTYHSNIPEYMEHYPGLSWLKHILGAFFRHQYNYLQSLYVPTPFIQRHLIDTYKMDKITTLKVWGRGVDVEKFNPAYRSLEYRRSLGIEDDVPVVLWVGRLVPEKRSDIFANVVRRLHNRGLKFHALVVGAGPCEAAVKALPNTTFLGWMSSDQLSTAYASSDIFLFPSAVETFGNVTLEAAASGLPVVVEAGCSGHLVHEGQNGFTADAGDEDGFFEHTLALVEDAQLREELSANGREMALSLEKRAVVRQMLNNYNDVSDEFYQEYSGHHANRDSVYTQPDSFTSGKYPRPCILIIVEYVFIALFTFCYNLSYVYNWIVDKVRPNRTSVKKPAKALPTPPAASALPKPTKSAVSPANVSFIELDDVEIGPKEPLLSADDNTTTTGFSSSQDTSSSTQSFGDCRLSHTLAKVFIDVVYMQARIESHARTMASSCVKRTPFTGTAKRKNSSVAISLEELRGRPETVCRGRSEALLEERSSREGSPVQERAFLRRSQSTVLDVY